MTAAYFEDHPTDPDKVIFRKPPLDQGPDYERGFVDGMLYQTQSSVYKAVNAMSKRTWVGLTDEEIEASKPTRSNDAVVWELAVEWAEAKLKDKNGF
jgi:hypothetical protein